MRRIVTSRVARRCLAVAGALALDRVLREPPTPWHPVAWFGTAMGRVESVLWCDRRTAGVAYTATGVGVGAAVGVVAQRLVGEVGTTLVVTGAVAGTELRRTAGRVLALLDADDLPSARNELRALAGRDASALDASGVSAAVIESLAENTVDATIATVGWAIGLGAVGAAAHRAVNTMDAMVGHRTPRHERFGWASARLDDLAAWVPARATATLVALVRPGRAREIVRVVRRDAGAHPSPNAGVAEAAVAAALGVQLGGTLRYGDRVEHRPTLGDGPRPRPDDVRRAIRLVDDVERAAAVLLVSTAIVATVAVAVTRERRRS